MSWAIGQFLVELKQVLESNPDADSRAQAPAEAELICCYLLEVNRSDLFLKMRESDLEQIKLSALKIAGARAGGKPLHYLLGKKIFHSHSYFVSPGVLVPRFETEGLFEIAIRELSRVNQGSSFAKGLEIGVGSGVLSIELLSQFKGLKMWATEVNPIAMKTAMENARAILQSDANRLRVLPVRDREDVFESLRLQGERNFEFLISNPPYVDPSDSIQKEVLEQEPLEALFAPTKDPLFYYRQIARNARSFLKPDGMIFLEIAHERALEVRRLFEEAEFQGNLERDFNDLNRYWVGKI